MTAIAISESPPNFVVELRPAANGQFSAKLQGLPPVYYGGTLEDAAHACLSGSYLIRSKLRRLHLRFALGYSFLLHDSDVRMTTYRGHIPLTESQRDAFRRLTWTEAVDLASQYAKQHYATGSVGESPHSEDYACPCHDEA